MTTITINKKEYALALSTRQCVEMEKTLNQNPVQAIIEMFTEDKLPLISNIVFVFYSMLKKYQKDITLDECYDLYDDYLAEGNKMMDIVATFIECLQDGGYLKKPDEEDKSEEKN